MSSILKKLTWDLHKQAEATVFTKKLLRKELSQQEYAIYLYNLLAIYDPLEWSAVRQGMFENIKGAERLKSLYADFKEIDDGSHYQLTPSVIEYHDYLIKLANDPYRRHLIKAHLYVRHMGDLNGGQTIKRQVEHLSSGTFYDFDNLDILKENIKKELTEDLGEEARTAFVYAIRMMKELGNE